MQNRVFRSRRDKKATALVWGIALLLWLFSFSIISSEGPFIDRLAGATITFLIGIIAPWFWLTTRYRVSGDSLHLQSGPFHRELKFGEIRRVTDNVTVRGWSFAFSRDALQIDVEGSPLGYQVSPLDRRGFLESLATGCTHLSAQGNELLSPDRELHAGASE